MMEGVAAVVVAFRAPVDMARLDLSSCGLTSLRMVCRRCSDPRCGSARLDAPNRACLSSRTSDGILK